MEVVINGTRYVPKGFDGPQFGVGVTTRNRPDLVKETVNAIVDTTPDGTPVVVVDDGSDKPLNVGPVEGRVHYIKHEQPQGIPASKNRCIEELMNLGVQHLFLFDDDTRPDAEGWWKPYIESPEHHLQYSWTHFKPKNTPLASMDVLYQDSHLTAYGWSMGCMLYFSRQAIERCGGMRLEFGMGMEEHADLSRRIYNAGLTSFVHQDVSCSAGLFYAGDEYQAVKRTLPGEDRVKLLERNQKIRQSYHHDAGYVEYRRPRDVVLSCYFNNSIDPQRGMRAPADPKRVEALCDSVSANGRELVLLTDCLDGFETVEATAVAYRQRWISYYQWLMEHPEVRFVWCVDATDVRMLNDPFPAMRPGVLYVGWEPKTVGIQWMRDNGKDIGDWLDVNAHRLLLNAGVVGCDRATMMAFMRRMNDMWYDLRSDAMHEMPFFNHVVYQHFPSHVTGPQVATLFKHNVTKDDHAWWAHK